MSARRELTTRETIAAGAMSGLVELLIMFPLDVVKTRAQLIQSEAGSGGGGGVLKSLSSIWTEGGVARLYRGILAPAMQEPIKRSVKFTANSVYSKWIPSDNFQSRFAAGALAGMSEAFTIAPFEVIKVRMQASNRLQVYESVPHCAREIIKTEGLTGLATGLESALWRNGAWNGCYFSIIWLIRKKVLVQGGNTQQQPSKLTNFMAGFLGGTVATVANNPFDVACSRMRNTLPGEASPLRWSLQSIAHIASKEGPAALYKGFFPKVLRLGPGGGIMILSFEVAKDFLVGT